MPNITFHSLHRLVQGLNLDELFPNMPVAIKNDLNNSTSTLNDNLKKIHFSLGERIDTEYDSDKITYPDTIKRLFEDENLVNIKNNFVSCFLLFYLYTYNLGNREYTEAIKSILNEKMVALFIFMQNMENKNDVMSLLHVELVSIETKKRTIHHPVQTFHVAPIHGNYTVSVYIMCQNTYLNQCAFSSWIHSNINVFNAFKELGESLTLQKNDLADIEDNDNNLSAIPTHETFQLTWEFYMESLKTLNQTDHSPDNINSIYIDLLSLINNADIIYHKPIIQGDHFKTKASTIARRHKELLHYPDIYTKEELARLYCYISEVLSKLSKEQKIQFFEMTMDQSNALIKFLSSSKEGIVYLNKLVTDWAIHENLSIISDALDTIEEEDEIDEEDDSNLKNNLTIQQEQIRKSIENQVSDSTVNWKDKGQKEKLTATIIQLPLREQAKYIWNAIYNQSSNLYTIYHTQRGRFKPSPSHLGSQLDQLATQLSIIQDDLYREIINNKDLLQQVKDIRDVLQKKQDTLYELYHLEDQDWSKLDKFLTQLEKTEKKITEYVASQTEHKWLSGLAKKEFGLRATFSQVQNSVSSIRNSLRQSIFSPPKPDSAKENNLVDKQQMPKQASFNERL